MFAVSRVCIVFIAVLPLFGQSLDWTGDVVLFGSAGNESSPLLISSLHGGSLRAFCFRDDSRLCSKISADAGSSWNPSTDTALTVSAVCAVADDEFQYVFIRHAADPAAFLFRCPPAANLWYSQPPVQIAPSHTGSVLTSALHVDALFAPSDPYLNLCWCEPGTASTINVWFAQSRNHGESFRAERMVHSFTASVGAGTGLSMTAAWSGEEERLLIAAVVDRLGSIPEQIRVFRSDDQGETWSDSGHVDEAYASQSEPCIAALGGYVVLGYLRSALAGYNDLCMSFSFDGGLTFAQPMKVSDTLTTERSPRLLIDAADSLFYLFSLREDSAGMATAIMRTAGLDRPWNISEASAICEPSSAVLAGGLTAVMNAEGPAVAWTSRFLTGDTDIRFDAAWRGSNVNENLFISPARISLGECYPNPFNSVTVLPLAVHHPGFVTMEMFDITGRRIATLHCGLLPMGEHQIPLHFSGLPSGLYFSKVNGCESVQRLFLVK